MILQYPDPMLMTPTEDYNIMSVEESTIKEHFEYLVKLIKSTEYGIAIAANQAGIPFSMFVYQDAEKCAERGMHISTFEAVINPYIISVSGPIQQVEVPEGCLSFDDDEVVLEGLQRYPGITVNYWTYPGMVEVVGRYIDGFEAQMFQHEIDHLRGIVFMERLTG